MKFHVSLISYESRNIWTFKTFHRHTYIYDPVVVLAKLDEQNTVWPCKCVRIRSDFFVNLKTPTLSFLLKFCYFCTK